MLYKAEYIDDSMEVFDAENDSEALTEAYSMESDEKHLTELHELNEDYDSIRVVF